MPERKTLVIGLDALTWTGIDKYLRDEGDSHIVELAENNTSGVSRSTMPPMTPSAWTTIATGVNPGKHGIFDFLRQDKETYQLSPVDYSRMERPAIWDIFNSYEKKIGVVNYPLANPPEEVDPFFISGIPAGNESNIAHPESLQKQLDLANYRTTPNVNPEEGVREYFEEVKDLTEIQYEVVLDLLNNYELDMLWSVFMGIDWIQHYLWDESIDGESALGQFYWYIDSVVGRFLDALNDEWQILILSDHGAKKIEGEIHMNTLLSNMGYLSELEEKKNLRGQLLGKLLAKGYQFRKTLPQSFRSLLKEKLPTKFLQTLRESSQETQLGMHKNIDWQETTAFSYGYMGRIFIHDSKSFPQGIVSDAEYDDVRESLIKDLENITHPKTDSSIIEHANPCGEYYDGPYMGSAPDILLEPKDWKYMIYNDFSSSWFHEPNNRIADHTPDGVFILGGEEVRNNSVNCNLTDFAPTLLYLHDLPLLDDMDGRVLEDAIKQSERQNREKNYVKPEAIKSSNRGEQLTKGVEDRLEDLGYL